MAASDCTEDRGPLLLAVGWTLLGLAVLTVATRIYFRSNLRHGINWDDHFVVASLVIGLVGGSLLTKLVHSGGGKHISCLPTGQIYPVLKWSLLAQVSNVLGIGLVKISVCLCVLRLIDRARRRLSQFLYALIAIVAISHLIQVLIFLVQCRPLNALWNPKLKGTCFSHRVTYAAGYANYEHYLGIIIASMPTLKPLFSKLLGTTISGSSQDSSRRSFQKINSAGITDRGPQSHGPSGRSSIGGDFNSRRTTDFRVSSHLELEVNRDYELQNGPLPDYLRHSGNSWAHESGLTQEHIQRVPTGGRKHVDDAFQSTSVPSIPKGEPTARIQPCERNHEQG
ncbi:MAG: hypothetical protein Q9180_003924 [Flavoplaca navasiana]